MTLSPGITQPLTVKAFSWGESNPTTIGSGGGGGGTGKVNFSTLNISIAENEVLPQLLLKAAQGTHFDTATLTYNWAGGSSKIELETVFVDSVQAAGSDHGPLPSVNFSLNFGQIKITSTPTGGSPTVGGWNVIQNKQP